jgi:hypothetical protein
MAIARDAAKAVLCVTVRDQKKKLFGIMDLAENAV